MSSVWRYLMLAAAPSAAFLAAQKALEAIASYDSHGPRRPTPTREFLTAAIDRLQAEYDDLKARQPAAKAHKLEAAALALEDAKNTLFRHDVAASLTSDAGSSVPRA